MKADYLSYKRAANASLLGMALQFVMGVAMLIYGAVAPDVAAQTGGLFILLGIPIWLVLAIVFDQHRRERIEAIENEALAQTGGRESSAFAEGADDFRVAHKRLVWMHRVLVPGVSLALALALAVVGYWRYLAGLQVVRNEAYQSSPNFGWPIAIGLGLAFTGFVFARYVAGMAKQPAWAALKAGAAASVGAAMAGLALAAAQFIDYAGPNTAIRWLHVIFPAAMFVVSIEFVLNFLLGIYRPRRQGEVPPPAFNSRLLGFVAAPDRIAESIGGALSYQFGFDVTGSWFYQLLSRSLTALVTVGVLVMWAMTSLAVVRPNEQGIRVRLGRQVNAAPLTPGPYLKLPWPLESIETYATTSARRINLGGEPPKLKGNRSILWTNDHGVAETYLAVQPTAAEKAVSAEREGDLPGARDVALIAAEVPLVFAVTDFIKYGRLAGADQREEILRAIGRREVFRYMATTSVDRVLGDGRAEISDILRKRVQSRFDDLDAGVEVLFVGIEGVHPPRETAASFETVVQSGQDREMNLKLGESDASRSLIEVAGSVDIARRIVDAIKSYEALTRDGPGARSSAEQAERIKTQERAIEELLTRAGGTAAATIQQARADRWSRHMGARMQAEQRVGYLAAFRAAPEVYLAQTYFRTLQEMMRGARVFIVAETGKIETRINLEEAQDAGNIFLKPKDETK